MLDDSQLNINHNKMLRNIAAILIIALTLPLLYGLAPAGDIRLFPNTENSPSIYIIPFTLTKALPSNSYILVTMDWYSASITPYNCILVNTSITIACTNLVTPTFPLTITTAQVLKFNSKLSTIKTVAILVKNNLLANTAYSLQLHLYDVIPNIQKISPSIEVCTMSYNGLIYEVNSNFGSVINNPPITNLMGVSILNTLSSNSPGSTSTLRAEVTISQAIATTLSTFIFVMQYPFTFSVGSIPAVLQSSLFATTPIALYNAPSIYSYEIVSPNIFVLIFNEQFVSGRKFIVQINQINNPFLISATNISIYSLNFNTLTPLEAYEMLYPIATISYPLTLTIGLPYSAPILGPMQFYQNLNQFVQLQISIPYSVPDGYSIKIQLLNANMIKGTAYSSFQSLTYTPVYAYTGSSLTISSMGPIPIGTVVSVTFQMTITTSSLFQVSAVIDTNAVITATAPTYVYYGLVQSSGVASSTFYYQIYDNAFGSMEKIKSTATVDTSQVFTLIINQGIGSIATSSGSYIDLYFSPNVIISSSFDQNADCSFYQSTYWTSWISNACLVTYFQTPNYFRVTIKANSVYSATVPNLFPFSSYTYITLKNLMFSVSSSNKNLYPIYMALYKSDVVNPTTYLTMTHVHAMPPYNALSGINFKYVNNFYSTPTGTNYQTYPNFLRFQSTTPAQLNLTIQPNNQLTVVFFANYGFRSIASVGNMQTYPCTSNIPVRCTFYSGAGSPYNQNQVFLYDRIAVTFLDLSYTNTSFHIIIPDTQINANTNYFYYQIGFYHLVFKDWVFSYSGSYSRGSGSWSSTASGAIATLGADISGKAGSYRRNASLTVYNNGIQTGGQSFIILSTQWSFFENGISSLTSATLGMATPATFGSNNMAPLALYITGGMYLTVIPFSYVSATTPFTFYLDNVHMPYTYDLPNYYIYVARRSDELMAASNSFLMTNGGILYSCPLQSLTISCQDNAIGVVSTYCTIQFGTTNPLLAYGNLRVSLSGMTVATNTCFLSASNGSSIPVTCSSSTDNTNVTVTLLASSGFYTAGTFTLVVYGMGISNNSLSQSMTLYLYDPGVQYVIETGVRILMTTIASLDYISLTQILYSYNNPLSYNTMSIKFYLPRMLYKDEEFCFVIGQDLSDVNTQTSRLNIIITRQDGMLLYPLFSIDNVNYLIIFSFTDPTLLISGNYVMTIYGICTPASQANGAFNMIYRRVYDFTYTIVNSANVIFPIFSNLVTSNIAMASYFNTEGYKQSIDFTIVNSNLNVDKNMVWIINFPSYYSPQLFQQDAYCLIDSAVISCYVDPNTPYQLVITGSPKTVVAGTSYTISVVGLACPRRLYTNNAYPSRYIFVGVLQNSSSLAYAERTLLLPQQNIQTTVGGITNVLDMIGVSVSALYSFSSLYAQFQLYSNVAISSGSYLYIDLPLQFDNLNNIGLSAILIYTTNVISSTTVVKNRRIQIPISINIPLQSPFRIQFPNLPTPKLPCTTQMSQIIVTVTPNNKLSIYSASDVEGNSAPRLTFVKNNKYISFNYDQTIVITAGTYSNAIDITSSDNHTFLSNININLTSSGFVFNPASVFLPIGVSKKSFIIGADSNLVPVVYFYQAIKQEEVNTNYQISLNMNIQVTNNPVTITLPTSLNMAKGGCTNPFIITLANPPFQDLTITYTFDNSNYSQNSFYPNPLTTLSQMDFNSTSYNNTFSFCSSSSLTATQIPVTFYLSGTNYNSYSFSPSNQILINIVSIPNIAPTIALSLNNQQKTFLDVNFTNNVDGMIFYHMLLGQNMVPLDIQSIQVYLKANTWILQAESNFLNYIYTVNQDNRLGQFFQTASTSTFRIQNLLPQTFYTLCAYIVNSFGVASASTCLQLSTMTWGSLIKASLVFGHSLTAQELNNVLCYFTLNSGTQQLYLVDMEGNSCGNRVVANRYYTYSGSSFTTQTLGTNIYLVTNPYLTGTDPAPLAFTNMFNALGQLSAATLATAQTQFSITYATGTYMTQYNARLMTQASQASGLTVYFQTPTYNSTNSVLTVNNVQIIGNVGTVYFVLVLYKQISNSNNGSTSVNIRLNYAPTAEQVLNCLKWNGQAADGCARAVYTGVSPLKVTFSGVQTNSLYELYFVAATQFPLRPIVSGAVSNQVIITYTNQRYVKMALAIVLLMMLLAF